MKRLYNSTRLVEALIISAMMGVFLLNLWMLSLSLTEPYESYTLFSFSDLGMGVDTWSVFGRIISIAFYGSILALVVSGGSILLKKTGGIKGALIYLLVFEMMVIAFQTFTQYLSFLALILILLKGLLIVALFFMMHVRKRSLEDGPEASRPDRESRGDKKGIPLYVLLIDILSIIALLTTFVIPLFSQDASGMIYHGILGKVLFSADTNLVTTGYFIAQLSVFIAVLLYFSNALSYYFFDKRRFVKKSDTLVTMAFITTLVFFMSGLGINIYYSFKGEAVQTLAYIPFVIMVVIMFTHSVIKGVFSKHSKEAPFNSNKKHYAHIEPLLYVFLLSAIAVAMLFLPVIRIDIVSSGYSDVVNLTGVDILRDYVELERGYQLMAFVLTVMLFSVGISLIVSVSGYLSKYRRFDSIVRSSSIIIVFFIFIVSVSGYYFKIAREINETVLRDIVTFYGLPLSSAIDYDYSFGTDAIYALIAALTVVVVMFFRNAFDQDLHSANLEIASSDSEGEASSNVASKGLEETEYHTFDPSPAFSDLDQQIDTYQKDLEKRNQLKVENPTLNKLVHFIVDYAKNSKQHLSYTPEKIAAFISGLGTSKLSILQGMSGTGKTSLPKILSEAIYGNCDIVEVESSWKDKNELLGYYNEFSMKYTPKKFTLALYKASLNPNIPTFILLDEMNLSRIEYYFSDFLSLMENEENERTIKLVNTNLRQRIEGKETDYEALSNGTTLKVPSNVWFIGTANRDESTFVISDKVYDRAYTMNFTKRAPKVRNYADPMVPEFYDYETLNTLLEEARKNGTFDAENNQTIKEVEKLLAPYNISFGNRILNQIEAFVNIYKACFEHENVEEDAIESILLTKVVSKLELKVIDDKESLEMGFEKLNLHRCVDFISQLDDE